MGQVHQHDLPVANGWLGLSVSVLSPFEKAIGPLALPLIRPKTRKLAAVIDVVSSAGRR
jgi:hypothetical protein